MRNRKRSHGWGIVAEYLCAGFLMLKGYSILALRHRNRYGEIDILAAKRQTLVCVEVKARAVRSSALESVTPDKRARLERAVTSYIATHANYAHHGLRFDVMVVTSPCNIHHLRDAWRS
jgi:putative endonuclease